MPFGHLLVELADANLAHSLELHQERAFREASMRRRVRQRPKSASGKKAFGSDAYCEHAIRDECTISNAISITFISIQCNRRIRHACSSTGCTAVTTVMYNGGHLRGLAKRLCAIFERSVRRIDGGHASLCPPYDSGDDDGAYLFPTFSHSHCATASGELVASLPAARRLASRIVAMSILPSSGASALRKPSSLARFGASSTIAS